MFDKFTNRAKQVIKLAKKEAQRLNHNYLGTEHVLLGLLKLGQGIAVNVLRNFNLDYDTVRAEIERLVGFGPEIQVYGDPALTGKVKKVFEFANEEALTLNHNYVGTEHLLLALLAPSRRRGSASFRKPQYQPQRYPQRDFERTRDLQFAASSHGHSWRPGPYATYLKGSRQRRNPRR